MAPGHFWKGEAWSEAASGSQCSGRKDLASWKQAGFRFIVQSCFDTGVCGERESQNVSGGGGTGASVNWDGRGRASLAEFRTYA